jgi:hypothetical protein
VSFTAQQLLSDPTGTLPGPLSGPKSMLALYYNTHQGAGEYCSYAVAPFSIDGSVMFASDAATPGDNKVRSRWVLYPHSQGSGHTICRTATCSPGR